MIRIKGGRVIDPANGIDKVTDICIKGGKLVSAASVKGMKGQTIDAKGLWVVPGLIDMHVHLREPGEEYKETISSGLEAAAAGGFTSVSCMPNTKPAIDNASLIEFLLKQASIANGVNLFPMGAISKGLKGKELAEIGDMVAAGAVAITDDGRGVASSSIMRSALEYASNFGVVVCAHCEDDQLVEGGSMHEGEMSTRLGLGGIPALAESIMVSRDVQLCEYTGSRYHVQHISTRQSVEMVRAAKKKGLQVSCEVAPHHWNITDQALEQYDTVFKMNPPLRSDEHVKAVRKALKDGVIDVIATDHAPHSELEKKVEFDQAANGVIGLETALPLSLGLVTDGLLDPSEMIAKLTINPARILGIDRGSLSVGAPADVTLIDPEHNWVYDKDEVHSKSCNSPWLNHELRGRAVFTIANGKIVHKVG